MVNVTGPRRLRRYERRDSISRFRGLNNELDPDLIADEEFSELVNFNVTTARTMAKRPGFRNWSTFQSAASSNILAVYDTGATPQIVSSFTGPSSTYASTDGGISWTIPISTTRSFYFATQYNNLLYLVDSTGVAKWDGTTLTAIAGSPGGCHIVAFKDRLWVCDGGTTSNFYYSDPGPSGVETWGASSVIKIRTGDPSSLVASQPFADRLMIFKTMSVWQLFLAGNIGSWQLRILNTERGAISENCVLTYQGLIYMLSWDGIWRTDGALFKELSNRVRRYFKLSPQPYRDASTALSVSNRRLFVCYRQRALPAVNGIAQCAYLWYSMDADAWSEMQVAPGAGNWRPSSIFNWYNPGTVPTLPASLQLVDSWSADASDTKTIFILDETTPTDRGFVFNCHLRTKIMDFGDSFDFKRCKVFLPELDSVNGAVPKITYGVDNQLDRIAVTAGEVVVQYPKLYRMQGPGYFRQVDVQLDESTSATMRVLTLNFVVMLKSLPGDNT